MKIKDVRLTIYALGFVLMIISSCIDRGNYVIIKGKVENDKLKTIYFNDLTDNPFEITGSNYTAEVDTNKSFEIKVPIKRLTVGKLNSGSTSIEIALLPTDNLSVVILDGEIQFNGKGAGKNNFLIQKTRENALRQYQLAQKKKEMPPNDFLKYAKEFRTNSYKTLEVKSKEFKLEKEFKDFISAQIDIEFDELVRKYDVRYSNQNNVPLDSINVSPIYRNYDNFTYIQDDRKVLFFSYVHYFTNDIHHVCTKIRKQNSSLTMKEAQHIALFDSLSGKTQEYVLANYITREFENKNYDTLAINKFYELNPDYISQEVVKNATDGFFEKQALLGKPLNVEFTETILTDTTGLETTLGNIITQLKGNVVYLDVWGMNCPPCRAAMPYAKELKENLENYPVEFLYLSNEKVEKNQWRNVFEATFTKNNHYVLKNGFDARFLKFMEINWVPCYIIIDKDGNLRDYNAERPGKYFNWQVEKELKRLAEE